MKVTNIDIDLDQTSKQSSFIDKFAGFFIVLSFIASAFIDGLFYVKVLALEAPSFLSGNAIFNLVLITLALALVSYLFFMFEFWVYKQILKINIFSFTIPNDKFKSGFYYAVGIRNFIMAILSVLVILLLPLAYNYLIVADMIILCLALYITIISLIKRYVPSAIRPLVFKTYSKPLIIILFIFIAIRVVGFFL